MDDEFEYGDEMEEPSFSGVDSAAGAPMYLQQQAGAYAAGQQMQQPEHMQRPASSHGPGAGVSGMAQSLAAAQHQAVQSPPSSRGHSAAGRTDHEAEVDGAHEGFGGQAATAAAYNAQDYLNLPVSKEVQDLFQLIGRYRPKHMEIETPLKPFIPEYVPATGDIDEFIKVPRPDGKPDLLGLKVLDEPCAHQSDPSVLMLQLRQTSKQAGTAAAAVDVVSKVEDAANNGRRITEWITDIGELQKGKPAAAVHYTKNMPDIDALMQQWPAEAEELLHKLQLPDETLDLPLKTFAQLVCNVLDIPMYANPIESLHHLFTLFLEFKNNPAFQDISFPGAKTQQGSIAMLTSPAADVMTM